MPQGELGQLAQRKKELLLESDINRQILRVELCQLKIKAAEWQRSLSKARSAYRWLAPGAGIFFAIHGMRKRMAAHATRTAHNGHGKGKADYLKLLAPIGIAALRKAFDFWRHAKKRDATPG